MAEGGGGEGDGGGGDGDGGEGGGIGGGEGGGEGGEGGGNGGAGGGLSFWAQTSNLSIPQPAFSPQLSPSSVTVQSLAPAVWQMVSASVKVARLLQNLKGPAACLYLEATHTEQPGGFCSSGQPGSRVSEQHLTWSRAAGHGQHARKRAAGWMRCKRTAYSSLTTLSPGIFVASQSV